MALPSSVVYSQSATFPNAQKVLSKLCHQVSPGGFFHAFLTGFSRAILGLLPSRSLHLVPTVWLYLFLSLIIIIELVFNS